MWGYHDTCGGISWVPWGYSNNRGFFPPRYWTPSMVLKISPTCIMTSPWYWAPPWYWTHIIQGDLFLLQTWPVLKQNVELNWSQLRALHLWIVFTIKTFVGRGEQGWWYPYIPSPHANIFNLYPHPLSRYLIRDALMTPHRTSNISHC